MRFRDIVFDLDGTLIDASERMHLLFQRLVPSSSLTKDEYWSLKRSGFSHSDILRERFPKVNLSTFETGWMSHIESSECLAHDILYPGTVDALSELSKRHRLFVVTARQCEDAMLNELDRLRVADYFEAAYATRSASTKAELFSFLMKAHGVEPHATLCVGDTESDIAYGHEAGFEVAAVTWGFRREVLLAACSPEHLVDNIAQIAGSIAIGVDPRLASRHHAK